MMNLRSYQKDAVDKICDFFHSNMNKAKICIQAGLGKTIVIVSSVQELHKKFGNGISIAVLAPSRMCCEQIRNAFLQENINLDIAISVREMTTERLLITTYQDIIRNRSKLQQFSLIICDEAQFVKNGEYLICDGKVKVLGIQEVTKSIEGWFSDAVCLFTYSKQEAIKDGYDVHFGEQQVVDSFLIPLLKWHGYQNIKKEKRILNDKSLRADIMAQKNGKIVIMEIKSYRGLHNSKTVLDNALKQILSYKYSLLPDSIEEKYSFIVVLLCEIDENIQNEIYKQHNIVIWDINNLIYLCGENEKLLSLLTGCISYPLLDLRLKKPIDVESKQNEIGISNDYKLSLAEKYMKELENCKAGKLKGADKKYEAICTEVVKVLFDSEFFKVSEQHRTNDDMFRMDLLCSLKGTTEFWKFLISFYHTKFVVFEYKNYSECISQNLIYITEKYLFPVALRNVAFIISRKGFDQNAEKAALGCLRESGKLIVSLNDDDLITMLSMKEKGEEPSDFLLDKVECMLMSVSK